MSNTDTCVVCGRTSSRSVWNNTVATGLGTDFTTTYVACDFHSLDEIETAIVSVTGGFQAPAAGVINQDSQLAESEQS